MKRVQSLRMFCCALAALVLLPLAGAAGPIPVSILYSRGEYTMLRDGLPYYVEGAGGTGNLELMAQSGANSLRTWGAPGTELLDRAHALGLTVAVGLWVEHERHGFDYGDPEAVAEQFERHKADIDRLKDHPAVLVWGIGNEVELEGSDPRVWDFIESVAAYAKKVDPHHPTMTTTAFVDAEIVELIHERAPSIDILGVNAYGGLPMIPQLVEDLWKGPYLVTEWGPDGTWEVEKTAWGAQIEPTSTEKAHSLALRYAVLASDRERCLGGYAFVWGYKQETTPTWFSMFLEDGSATESIEVLATCWAGERPEHPAPRLAGLRLDGQRPEDNLTVRPGQEMEADFVLLHPRMEEVQVEWLLAPESEDKRMGGDREARPRERTIAPDGKAPNHLVFTAPVEPGAYRLFLRVYDEDRKSVATANFPFLVAQQPVSPEAKPE